MSAGLGTWSCPVCAGRTHRNTFRRRSTAPSEPSTDFRPASSAFGSTLGVLVRCVTCGHGVVAPAPFAAGLARSYAHVSDEDSLQEEQGRLATARRDLAMIAAHVGVDRRRLLDVGCWTGSLVSAAAEAGWEAEGIEPSSWAAARAQADGRAVRVGSIDDLGSDVPFQVVTCCDVIEHLVDPGAGLDRLVAVLEPGGWLFLTAPDAGSGLARLLGPRWWSVLPMHVQYFTRRSMTRLLERHGLEVVSVTTHPKVFTRRYYLERLGEFVPVVGRRLAVVACRLPGVDRPVGPDFRDRMAVVARRLV